VDKFSSLAAVGGVLTGIGVAAERGLTKTADAAGSVQTRMNILQHATAARPEGVPSSMR